MCLLKPSLNVVFAKTKNVSSSLLGADTTALYTRFAVKHLLSSWLPALLIYDCIFVYERLVR